MLETKQKTGEKAHQLYNPVSASASFLYIFPVNVTFLFWDMCRISVSQPSFFKIYLVESIKDFDYSWGDEKRNYFHNRNEIAYSSETLD